MNFTSFFLLVYLFTTFELKVLDKFLMTTKAQLGSLKILLPDLFNTMTLLKIKYFLLHRKMSSHHKKKNRKKIIFHSFVVSNPFVYLCFCTFDVRKKKDMNILQNHFFFLIFSAFTHSIHALVIVVSHSTMEPFRAINDGCLQLFRMEQNCAKIIF